MKTKRLRQFRYEATATRHWQDLVEKGVMLAWKGGRSTDYQVNLG